MNSKSNRNLATLNAAELASTREGRRVLRSQAGAPGYVPVTLVDGDREPSYEGHGFYYTTPSGKTIVRHPRAYGWRTLYHRSSREVVVGRDWRPLANAA